jgi:DNA invertase Pin-like site-specific DNA recombinase
LFLHLIIKAARPEFQKLLSVLEQGDTLTVTKLDRFARSTSDALAIVKPLFEKGVKVNVLNMGIIENTPTGRLTFTIFSVFAEFERDLIVTRTQEGKSDRART